MAAFTASIILFDAGDTLVRPLTGDWSIPPCFFAILDAAGLPAPPADRLRRGIERGGAFLAAHHRVDTLAEELARFTEFYRIVLHDEYAAAALGMLSKALAQDWVRNHDKYVVFDDVPVVLPRLKERGYTLGVLSNTYPSLEDAFRVKGIRHLFSPFFISSKVGVEKPSRKIFDYAVSSLAVAPREILFIDDREENIAAAAAVGMHGIVIDRYGSRGPTDGDAIRDLYELERSLPDSF